MWSIHRKANVCRKIRKNYINSFLFFFVLFFVYSSCFIVSFILYIHCLKKNFFIYFFKFFFVYICDIIGRTTDDAKNFGEENDIILVLGSSIGICLKNDLKMGSDN